MQFCMVGVDVFAATQRRKVPYHIYPLICVVAVSVIESIPDFYMNANNLLLYQIAKYLRSLLNGLLCAVSGGSKSVFAKENDSVLLLVASQKTLLVLVAAVDRLGGTFGNSGLLALPCVAAHLNQKGDFDVPWSSKWCILLGTSSHN